MGKNLRKIEFDKLSELLQGYLDKGETVKALEYCENLARANNPYGYVFMGFIYEEGHGVVGVNYRKALHCYEKAHELGIDTLDDIKRVQLFISKLETYIQTYKK